MNVSVQNVVSVLVGMILGGLLAGCGTVGPPVPPENVGLNPIIRQQKKQEALEKKHREAATAAESVELSPDPALQGQDVILPPLRPVGTR
jgi:predicted small lipoprotein YifL